MLFRKNLPIVTTLATALTTALALPLPLPLHNTNTQRLPDHPSTIKQSEQPATIIAQKQKYVPDVAAAIIRLCGRSVHNMDMILGPLNELGQELRHL